MPFPGSKPAGLTPRSLPPGPHGAPPGAPAPPFGGGAGPAPAPPFAGAPPFSGGAAPPFSGGTAPPFSGGAAPPFSGGAAPPFSGGGEDARHAPSVPSKPPATLEEAKAGDDDEMPPDEFDDGGLGPREAGAGVGDSLTAHHPEGEQGWGDDAHRQTSGDGEETPREDVEEDTNAEPNADGTANAVSNPASNDVGAPLLDDNYIQAERARLRDLVHRFVTKAVDGVPCTLLAEGKRTPSRYKVDSSLENLLIVSAEDPTHVMVTCRIASIEDVYSVADDGTSPFPPEVIGSMAAEELDALLMIVFRVSREKLFRFCLLEESAESCSTFMEAMSCLHMYAQPQQDKRRQNAAESNSKKLPDKAAVGKLATRAADAAMANQASVDYFLRCVGVQGGKGALGPLVSRAVKFQRHVPLTPLAPKEVPAYLKGYGYDAQNEMSWRILPKADADFRPRLEIRVTQHIEVAGHTWYMLECTLMLDGAGKQPRLDWQTPRRLTHLRRDLHDQVKAYLGTGYGHAFGRARFARAGGLPGTTAALNKWAAALAKCIASGTAAPTLVALVLRFLEAPSPELPNDIEIS